MSVLIRGMEMPKNCIECPFCKSYMASTDQRYKMYYFCRVLDRAKGDEDCPLIELPPHGDLIDRSKLAWTPIDITDLPFGECLPVYLKEDVDSAPIVVGSEE